MCKTELPLRADYYTFTPTGDDAIDGILRAVAYAGLMFHHTRDWNDNGHITRIQKAALAAARQRAKQSKRDTPQAVEISPSGMYAYVVGIPAESDDEETGHNCDAAGCPSADAHTLMTLPIMKPTIRRPDRSATLQALRPSYVPSLMHVVSMLDHGNTKVAREEALRLLNEVRGRE